MKRCRAATARRPDAASGGSMFPFLAVLISTMGALILLLVVIARNARLQAAETVLASTAEQAGRIEAERELVQWRIEQIKQSRTAAESELTDARLKLGRTENHVRQLGDKLVELQSARDDLKLSADGNMTWRKGRAEELVEWKRRIALAEIELAEARKAAAERQGSYAVVPYQGPHETHRRPMYIECLADAVVIQPEGIVLTEADFIKPLGPGNPLDVAMRARREYLLDHGQFDPEASTKPYPLLLVRPKGIEAYYVARAAMQSWIAEFGYELIGEDWELEFPPADPRLADIVTQAVDMARIRQARRLQTMMAMADTDDRPTYHDQPVGGFASGSTEPTFPSNTTAPGNTTFPGNTTAPSDTTAPGNTTAPSDTTAPGNTTAEKSTTRPTPTSRHPMGNRAQASKRPEASGTSEALTSSPAEGMDPATNSQAALQPLAEIRGLDWGLPDASRSSIPVTRFIRVDCYQDRLVLVPDQEDIRTIPLDVHTADAVDSFISSAWDLMETWGIAGQGMYWRPILNVRVAPNAGWRFDELKTLLDGSGFKMQRKEGRGASPR